ncbi:MAG: BamA/TamA family outer membrane protein [Gammaproteobacteria bacterium]
MARKPRSIGAGAGYATDEGPIVSFFWEHRNFLGAGEKFESELYFSPLRQELSTNFINPDVGARKHNLLASTSVKAEDTDAYESKSVGAGVAIERPLWSDRVTGSLGVASLGQWRDVAWAFGEQPTRLRILWGESPLPSITRFRRRAYPLHGEVTNRDRRGRKSHGCPAPRGAAVGAIGVAS